MRMSTLLLLPLCFEFTCVSLAAASDDARPDNALGALETRIKNLEKKVDAGNKRIITDGFFTAAYARSDDASLTENWGGITNKNNFSPLSTFGVQLTYQINPKTHAVTQFIARGEEEWDLEAEWAYFNYTLNDDLIFRIGRQKAPLYLLSEYFDVSYASPWISPPDEVYGITGDSTYEGISFLYALPTTDWDSKLQVLWGNNTFTSVLLGNIALNDLISTNITFRNDTSTFRLGYAGVIGDIPAFNAPLPAFPNTPITAGDTLYFEGNAHVDIRYASAGFAYDDGKLQVMSELVQLKLAGWSADVNAAYLMAGYHFGKLMPHLTYSRMKNADSGERSKAIIRSGSTGQAYTLPGNTAEQIANHLIEQTQSTYTLGLRYELAHSMSAKAEWSHITDFDDTTGQFRVSAPPTENQVNIIKFGIDAVF